MTDDSRKCFQERIGCLEIVKVHRSCSVPLSKDLFRRIISRAETYQAWVCVSFVVHRLGPVSKAKQNLAPFFFTKKLFTDVNNVLKTFSLLSIFQIFPNE